MCVRACVRVCVCVRAAMLMCIYMCDEETTTQHVFVRLQIHNVHACLSCFLYNVLVVSTSLLTAHTHTHTQYLSLMKELGESVPGGAPTNPQVSNKPSQAGVGVGTNVPPPMALVRKTQSCDSHVTVM